jgi:hypothetical protein
LGIVGEEEGLGEDEGEGGVAFEGEEEVVGGAGGGGGAGGDDAEVLVVGGHEDVGGAEVDLVGAEVAADEEEFVGEGPAVFELGEAGEEG